MEKNIENVANGTDEISLKEILLKTQAIYRYLKSRWFTILIAAILGGALGLVYSIFKKPIYTAICTFVLEESNKAGALSQYAGLASMAGIDIGSSGGGVFQGDNILELYKSRTMLEKTLLCPVAFNGKNQLLIDRYIVANKLRERWKKHDGIDSIVFTGDPEKFNRTQDSVVTDIIDALNKKALTVTKPDKKLSIINVTVKSPDEVFAQMFTLKLVENVNKFYVQTKTKKSNQSVQILTRQRDSVRAILNSSINGVASAIDATPNANPGLLTLRVPSQRKQVDVQASSNVYAEIVKQLELSKISLQQETPLIQVIDQPVLPLEINKTGHITGCLAGLVIGMLLSMMVLIVPPIFRSFAAMINS